MKLVNSILDLVGNTPILELHNLKKTLSLSANIYLKLESFNIGQSIKDRIAKEMIVKGIESGLINSKTTIIEPTSGNTGIGIALIAASMQLKTIIVMPSNMSNERKALISHFGAELVLTDEKLGMSGAIDKANSLNKEITNSIILSQFSNINNKLAHLKTGCEIYEALDGKIDYFISGIGTGGTISGVGEYLKSKSDNIKVIGIEPATSPFLTKNLAGSHAIMGIGAGFKPDILNLNVIDKIETVDINECYHFARLLAKYEGIGCGISTGANLAVAIKYALLPESSNKNIVTIQVDTAERYLSTDLFKNEF